MIFRYIRQKQSQLLHCANVSPGTLSSFSLGYCLIWFQPLASFQIMVFHWMPFFTVAVQNNHCRDCPACPDRWLCKRCYLLNLRVAGELAWMAGKLFLILNPTWNWQHYGSFRAKGESRFWHVALVTSLPKYAEATHSSGLFLFLLIDGTTYPSSPPNKVYLKWTILLEFKGETLGQASHKSQKLPGGGEKEEKSPCNLNTGLKVMWRWHMMDKQPYGEQSFALYIRNCITTWTMIFWIFTDVGSLWEFCHITKK